MAPALARCWGLEDIRREQQDIDSIGLGRPFPRAAAWRPGNAALRKSCGIEIFAIVCPRVSCYLPAHDCDRPRRCGTRRTTLHTTSHLRSFTGGSRFAGTGCCPPSWVEAFCLASGSFWVNCLVRALPGEAFILSAGADLCRSGARDHAAGAASHEVCGPRRRFLYEDACLAVCRSPFYACGRFLSLGIGACKSFTHQTLRMFSGLFVYAFYADLPSLGGGACET